MYTFITAYWHADFFGKCIFLALFALSITTWIFLVNKLMLFRTVRSTSKSFRTNLLAQTGSVLGIHLEQMHWQAAHPFGKIYSITREKTTEILDKNNSYSKEERNFLSSADIDLISSHVEAVIISQREKLESNFYILTTAVALAPFLGLLGTVWGMLVSFSAMQTGGHAMSNSAMLGGLATALTTTVLGLLIAIPALIAQNYLKNESKMYHGEMENFGHTLLSTLELQYRKVDIG